MTEIPDQRVPAETTGAAQGALFAHFELNREPRWPLLARLCAASLVLHVILFAVFSYVPTVRSMIELAAMFAGADYVSEDYARVAVGERAQIINIADPNGLFQYPPGYFSSPPPPLTSAGEPMPTPTPAEENAVVISEHRPERAQRRRPTPTPAATPAASPAASPELAQNTTGEANPAAAPSPTPATEEETQAALERQAAEHGVQRPPRVNAQPFRDLLAEAKQMLDRGQLDLTGQIEMIIEADRNQDGTLRNVEIVGGSATNESLKEISTRFVQALSASRALSFLEGVEHLRMTIRLDQQRVTVRAVSEVETAERATEMARGYGGMLTIERWRRRGRDEGAVWNNVNISASGRQLNVSFEMPRNTAADLLSRQVPQTPAANN